MADVEVYTGSKGSITGFVETNIPTGNPDIVKTGMSVDQLFRFLLNQSDLNFPSADRILRLEQQIQDHLNDFANPHRTTLDQIMGNLITQILGAIVPGNTPDMVPFYSLDTSLELPFNSILAATYTSANLYRQSAGGWLINTGDESEVIGTDYLTSNPGVPLFSSLTNITPTDWNTTAGVGFNTSVVDSVDADLNYPFTFATVSETPTTAQFGINIPITANLLTTYATSFFIKPSEELGSIRVFQPNSPSDYVEVNLDTGATLIVSDSMTGVAIRYPSGVIRVSVGYTTDISTPSQYLRVVHINPAQSGDGTRIGSLGRALFSIGLPQTTTGVVGAPALVDGDVAATSSRIVLDLSKVSAPATLPEVIVTMAFTTFPGVRLTSVVDPTVFTFGNLRITRDASTLSVSVDGTIVHSEDLAEGLNVLSLSYAADQIIYKSFGNDRVVLTGTFAPLDTTNVSFGPFGGYLHDVAFYAQKDDKAILEYLTNG